MIYSQTEPNWTFFFESAKDLLKQNQVQAVPG
jgi:hypothetical protein